MRNQSSAVQAVLRALNDKTVAAHSQRFFKTGKGEYAYGDKFLGIRVPILRKIAKQYQDLSVLQTLKLLRSPYHEERLVALLILVRAYRRGDTNEQNEIYSAYLKHTQYINNWDLVDTSAEHIVGAHLLTRNKQILYDLAKSDSLWERRIAVMSTFHFIKKNKFTVTLRLIRVLLDDEHDLIHKATGWMLREIGNRDRVVEEKFLSKYYNVMPRTMLRYAIEKFPEKLRQRYLSGTA